MDTNSYMFGYVKNFYTLISDRITSTDVIYISGETRIGKTYLAQSCMGRVTDSEYFKLYLKSYSNYNPSYAPFQLGLMKFDTHYESKRKFLVDVLESSEKPTLKVLSEFIEYNRTYREKMLFQLNDIELSIINRISFQCKGRNLFMVVDDYEKWDEDSKKFLAFLMTNEARSNLPFLKSLKVIIVGEQELTLKEIQKIHMPVFSVRLLGYQYEQEFIHDISAVNGSYKEPFLRTLFEITKGNLGLSLDILSYLKDDYPEYNTDQVWNISHYKELFYNVLNIRTHSLDEIQSDFIRTIKISSICGEIFNKIYLPEVIGENEFAIDKILSTALNNRFINIYENNFCMYNFFNHIVYEYFNENFNENKKEYHYRFALALKKFRPDDYYMQFFHLRAAGKCFEAGESLIIYLIRQEQDFCSIDSELISYLRTDNPRLYEDYKIIVNAVKKFQDNDMNAAMEYLDLISPISELLLLEKDYLRAVFIYNNDKVVDYQEVIDMLNIKDSFFKETYFDMWLRYNFLLYIFYVNRLGKAKKARTVEKRIMKEIAKRYKYTPDLEIAIQLLNRNSGAIYSTEIALQKTEKSVNYFEMHIQKNTLHYIKALTNFSGLLLVASDYSKAFTYSQIAINFIRNKQIWFKDVYKVVNNYVLSGCLANKFTYNEACDSFERLLSNPILKKKVLLLSNYYVLKILSGESNEVFEDYLKLYQSKYVQEHNDYYIYLTGINLICISLVTNHYELAQDVFERINWLIPSICNKEAYYINRRYEIFKKAIARKITTITELEHIFQEELSTIPYDYVKKPFILTDQQFWSFI